MHGVRVEVPRADEYPAVVVDGVPHGPAHISGEQRCPADGVGAIAPGHPGGPPGVAGHPGPSHPGHDRPPAVVVGGPAERLFGHPGPAIAGPDPPAVDVGTPIRHLDLPRGDEDVTVLRRLDPRPVGREPGVEVVEADAGPCLLRYRDRFDPLLHLGRLGGLAPCLGDLVGRRRQRSGCLDVVGLGRLGCVPLLLCPGRELVYGLLLVEGLMGGAR